MSITPRSFVHSDVLRVSVANTSGGPVTDSLVFCTGIAEFVFNATQDNVLVRDTLQFVVPDETPPDGSQPGPLIFGGEFRDAVATASLASIDTNSSDTALWAVDSVAATVDQGSHVVLLTIDIAVKGGRAKNVHLYRVAYQATVQVGPALS